MKTEIKTETEKVANPYAELEKLCPVLGELKFTDKNSYLGWRSAWRTTYKTVSAESRAIKLACRAYASCVGGGTKFDKLDTTRVTMQASAYWRAKSQWGHEYVGLHLSQVASLLCTMATIMLEQRKQSKIKVQELYLAERRRCSA